MTEQTFIPGKDLSLEATIAQATSHLKPLELDIEAVSWLNPAPHCWSVHIQSNRCPALYTNGKGVSREACLASGLGEFVERMSTNFFFADYYLKNPSEDLPFTFYPDEERFPPDNSVIPRQNSEGTPLLNSELHSFYDPQGDLCFEHLCDNNSDHIEQTICALPFKSLSTGNTTYFPVSLLNNLYVSNGMASGNSPAEACSQALSEIIERYVKNIIIAKGIALPDVPANYLKHYPKLCTILDTLNQGDLTVRVKDGSLGGQFPVIAVLLTDAKNGGAFAAFGANCRFETAIERTLTELLQGRELHGFKTCQPPCHDLNLVADPFNLESHFIDSDGLLAWQMFQDRPDFSFSPWDFRGTTEEEFNRLHSLVKQHGFHCYRAEYQHLGMYCCRFIVPGMSEIYPVDDLIWNNKNSGASLRTYLLGLGEMSTEQLQQFFDMLEGLGFSDQQLVSYTVGLLFDADSAWATLRIGELKAMILLALKNTHLALQWCDWSLSYGELPKKRKRLYRLLQTLLNFKLNGQAPVDYKEGLRLFYSDEELVKGLDIIDGKMTFPGLTFTGSWTTISKEHKKLLDVYQRLNMLKNIKS